MRGLLLSAVTAVLVGTSASAALGQTGSEPDQQPTREIRKVPVVRVGDRKVRRVPVREATRADIARMLLGNSFKVVTPDPAPSQTPTVTRLTVVTPNPSQFGPVTPFLAPVITFDTPFDAPITPDTPLFAPLIIPGMPFQGPIITPSTPIVTPNAPLITATTRFNAPIITPGTPFQAPIITPSTPFLAPIITPTAPEIGTAVTGGTVTVRTTPITSAPSNFGPVGALGAPQTFAPTEFLPAGIVTRRPIRTQKRVIRRPSAPRVRNATSAMPGNSCPQSRARQVQTRTPAAQPARPRR